MTTNPPPPQRYVRRDDPVLSRYGYTARSVRRAQSDGRLSRVKLSGPTGPCLVDLHEVRDPEAQAALIDVVQKADSALWEDA